MLLRVSQSLVRALAQWLAVLSAAFVLFHMVPQDPARSILGANASELQVAQLRSELGLDRPLVHQFAAYATSILTFDLGVSYVDRRSVAREVLGRLPLTLALGTIALVLTLLYLAVVVVAQYSGWSRWIAAADFAMSSMPTLFVAVVMVLLVSSFSPFRYAGSFAVGQSFLALLPASLVLAFYPMAVLSRLLRQQIREVRTAMFVTVARSMGVPEARVNFRHILPNAALPALAVLANLIPAMLTATFIVEIVFSLPGLGTLLIRSILQRDLPMIEGIVMVNAAVTLTCAFLIELSMVLMDPRLRTDAR